MSYYFDNMVRPCLLDRLRATSGLFVLDTFPNAERAFSLRKLKSSAVNCIRVRRSSDNTEMDIGFIGNEIDTSALLSFCGSGNGFVRTWYDQTGNNNHFHQTGLSQQMRIVNNGNIELENGKPAINGIRGTYMNAPTNTSFLGYSVLVSSNNISDPGANAAITQSDSSSFITFLNIQSTNTSDAQNRSARVNNIGAHIVYAEINTNSRQSIIVHSSDTENYSIRIDGNSQILGIAAGENTGNWFGLYLFDMFINRLDRISPVNYAGKYQEIIFYNEDKSDVIEQIEQNILTHYGI